MNSILGDICWNKTESQSSMCHNQTAVCSLQAAGGMNSPGPRRSARFASQQKSDSRSSGQQQPPRPGSRQPGTGTQTQLQRSWLQTFAWIAWGALAVLVAVMAATNPSRAAFLDSISQLTSRGLGQWAGALLLYPLTPKLIGWLCKMGLQHSGHVMCNTMVRYYGIHVAYA